VHDGSVDVVVGASGGTCPYKICDLIDYSLLSAMPVDCRDNGKNRLDMGDPAAFSSSVSVKLEAVFMAEPDGTKFSP